jgi:hypothetical protein
LVGLRYLAKLTFTITAHLEEILRQLDCLLGIRPQDGEAADQLFGLGERPSVTLTFPLVEGTPAERAWQAALSGTSQPAFIHSSISLPILSISSCDGGAFLSTFLYMLGNFIAIFLYLCFEFGSIASNYRSYGLNYTFLPACF